MLLDISKILALNKGRDRSAEELDRDTGEEQITAGRTRRKDGG